MSTFIHLVIKLDEGEETYPDGGSVTLVVEPEWTGETAAVGEWTVTGEVITAGPVEQR